MLNSNTDKRVLGPPVFTVVPAGNHMGKILGMAVRFAHEKLPLVQEFVQFVLE